MAQQIINIGTAANDKNGDPIRTAFGKVNSNFTDVYEQLVTLSASSTIPSQTGHSGYFLSTNGSSLSWAVPVSFPYQTGNAGKVLTTDGASVFWSTVSSGGGVSLSAFSVTTNSASGSGSLAYNNVTGVFTFTPPVVPTVPTYTVSTGSASGGGSLSLNGSTFTFLPANVPTVPTYTVATNTASGNGSLSLSGSTFTFTPANVPTYSVSTTTASGGGTLSVSGSTFTFAPAVQYTLPTATTSVLGGVKIDNNSIVINNGVISVGGALTSATIFKGAWDASANTPTLSSSLPAGVASGWQYIVSVQGTRDIGAGSTAYTVGDLVIYNGTSWSRIPGGNNVTAFNSRQGSITLTSSDVTTALGFTPYNSTNPSNHITLTGLSITTNAASGGGSLSYSNTSGVFTFTPPNLSNYLTSITSNNVTTALGYTPYNGSTNPSSYIALTGLSVTTAAANSISSLSYSNTTGVFTFTPYSLPTAVAGTSSTGTKGGVIPDGTSITINNGVISSISSAPNILVNTNAASGGGAVSYSNSTGTINFTPAAGITVNGTAISLGGTATITAAAGTLTGNTLASNITSSSLTGLGTLSTLTVSGATSLGATLTTTSTSFDLVNTTATTVNFAGAGTSINIGASTGTTLVNNNLTVNGNLDVKGTTSYIESTTVQVLDKNIEIGKVASPTDSTADGGGITLKGATDKTINWDLANNNWTSSENWNIATGKVFKINNTSVLSASTLGSGVTGSSLTSVGTIGTGVWQGTIVGSTYGGTGVNNGANTLTLAGNVSHAGAFTQTFTAVGNTSLTLPTSGTVTALGNTTTGSGNIVLATSPTLSTPIIGVATATSINKMAITAPATGSTLAVADGKTFTVNNTITLAGTDSITITLPATTGTVALNNQTFFIGSTSIAINRATASQSLTGITSIDGYAAGLAGGNTTTLLGALPYQSAANTTTLLSPNTTATKNFLVQTGTGTNGAAPAWGTLATGDIPAHYIGTTSITFNRTSATQSLTGVNIDGSAGKATNLVGGNSTTLLGSIGYQSGTDTTTLLSPNITTTRKFLRQTGDGTNGAAPAWDTLVAGDIPSLTSANLATILSDETGTGVVVFGTSPAITTSITTASTTFALINTTATTVNFAGGATTALNIGASTAPVTAFAATATTSSTASSLGYLGMPQNSQSGSTYAIVIGDAGKHLYFTGATCTATIPANSATAFPIGTTIAFICSSATTLTIAITTDTMYLGGTGTTGSRTLAAYGMATAVKVTATAWFINGTGLT